MEFREKLKKLRVSKNLSQQALADAIFVSRSAVAKWEAGLGMPSFDSLLALERYFGVEEGYFLTDKPDEVIVKKNIAVRRLWTAVGVASFVFLFLFSVLLMVSVMCDSYGLTSKMAAGSVFYDNDCIHNDDYDIYYSKMDIYQGEGESREKIGEYIHAFRPVRKLAIGYGVFEEDYTYRKFYDEDGYLGIIYSIKGKGCYYNIIEIKHNTFPADLLLFDKIIANGKEYDATYNSYFVTDEKPTSLTVGNTDLRMGPLEYK